MYSLDLLQSVARALSFFNTIAFLWLGLAVLLNAQDRRAVTWIAGSGLVLAGIFFAVHSTLIGRELLSLQADLAFWWRFLWPMFVVPPCMWYLAIGWYSGAFGFRRHRSEAIAAAALGLAMLAPSAIPGMLPAYDDAVSGSQGPVSSILGVPAAALAYPAYAALCFALSLVALSRPGATKRFMGDLGRRRAQPWLVSASFVLLLVSFAVGTVAVWVLYRPRSGSLDLFSAQTLEVLMTVDVAVSALLAMVVVLLGRAIVSYEIFTGRALPRGGLLRQWRNSLILAGGYGVMMAISLAVPVDPIYRLMAPTLLIAVFYALLSWRSYSEREKNIERLRPFVASQRLYDRLLRSPTPLDVDVREPFRALCEDVLGARGAYLIPLGPMAPLVERPTAYPANTQPPVVDLRVLADRVRAPGVLTVALDPASFGGAVWAVPLWSERGLIGALLLGEKRDGSLYVQEEIEVARSAAERLIDVQAGAEMARRLMAAQRQRLQESQLLDRQARRVLHDDVLPELHTALLALTRLDGEAAAAVKSLTEAHHLISDLLHAMPALSHPELGRLGLVGALRAAIEGELGAAFDGATLTVEPEAEIEARELSPLVAEAIYGAAREAIRNAARHGRGSEGGRPLHLSATVARNGGIEVVIEDDGVGMSAGRDDESSGQGLALHSTMMAVVGGTLAVEPAPTGGTRVTIVLPSENAPV